MFLVSLDGSTFTAAVSPHTYSGLAAGGHTFEVKAEDQAGNFSTPASYTWTIVGASTTNVTNVTSTLADGTYGTGEVIPISITFSGAVTVSTGHGTPQLALSALPVGGATASYASGSGSNTLVFDYTIAAGQSSTHLDYASTSALTLQGGSIQATGGASVSLTLPVPGTAGSLGFNKRFVINTSIVPTPMPVATTEGASFLGVVATFTDADRNTTPSRYTATITWGDGHVLSAFAVLYDFGSKRFLVYGAHTYAEEGRYVAQVLIRDSDGTSATVNTPVTVAEAPLRANSVSISASLATGWVTVATFTDTGGPEPVADYAATIKWGDSTPLDSGTRIVAEGNGSFLVQGRHTYANAGNYTVTVVIAHETVSTTVTDNARISSQRNNPSHMAAVVLSPLAADAVLADYKPSWSLHSLL